MNYNFVRERYKCKIKNKKCPCRLWTNCPLYIDITTQNIRLKIKNNNLNNEITNWYLTQFRLDFNFHDLYCSG